MTALQADLEIYGRYAAARRLAAARGAVATTGSDLRHVEREESPTATDPDVGVSTHPAPTVQPVPDAAIANAQTVLDPGD